MTTKVLLVGCGITSAITGKLLQAEFENINITFWESLNEYGGRFNTKIIGGNSVKHSVDLGAQYITTTDETMKSCDDVYSSLFNDKVLKFMDIKIKGMKQLLEDKKNYVAPLGMKSVVDHFLQQINCHICYGHKLTSLDCKLNKWSASTDSGTEELFDIVILTLPVPEIFNLNGDVRSLILNDDHISKLLSAVKYSSRFALGLFFEDDVLTDSDSEFIEGDSILRYIATDRWKMKNGDTFRSAVIHTTIQFGEKYYKDDLSAVEGVIMKQVRKVFPQWPKPSSLVTYQWKYSQVLQPCNSKPGAITLAEQPLLIAGGDGFVGSTFDQCLFSARTISELVSKNISYFSNITS